jgi:hypothetical protein
VVTPAEIEAASKRIDDATEAFRRAAKKAVAAAADPKAYPMTVTEARHQATFALAAVGAAFKAALRLARPDDPNV